MFTLLYPYFLLLIPLYFLCIKFCQSKIRELYFSNFNMLVKSTKEEKNYIKILQYIIISLLVVAISSPVIEKHITLKDRLGYDISLLVDVSGSMAEDNRLSVTKTILKDFIKKRSSDNIALSFFADFASIASPLTSDTKSLEDIVDYIKLGIAGYRDTALYEALYLGADIFKNSSSKNRVMILLTDGIDTVGTIPLDIAIKKVKKYGIKVYVIAIGKSGDYDEKVLKKIASETKGVFYKTSNPRDLEKFYDSINSLEKGKIKSESYNYYSYYFQYILFVVVVLFGVYLFFVRNRYLVLSYIFLLLALYRPTIDIGNVSSNRSSAKFIVAFDISYSMNSSDIYPSRFKFAQQKFYDMLGVLSKESIAVYGFANQTYLISSYSKDYDSLKYLVSHIDLKYIDQKGSDISELLYNMPDGSSIVIFTDGTSKKDLSKEKEYIKQHNLQVYIYAIASSRGDVIKVEDKILLDKNKNIIITNLNSSIKDIAKIYRRYSLEKDDLKQIIEDIRKTATKDKSISRYTKQELFYIPLLFSIIFFFFGTIRFRGRR